MHVLEAQMCVRICASWRVVSTWWWGLLAVCMTWSPAALFVLIQSSSLFLTRLMKCCLEGESHNYHIFYLHSNRLQLYMCIHTLVINMVFFIPFHFHFLMFFFLLQIQRSNSWCVQDVVCRCAGHLTVCYHAWWCIRSFALLHERPRAHSCAEGGGNV